MASVSLVAEAEDSSARYESAFGNGGLASVRSENNVWVGSLVTVRNQVDGSGSKAY